MRPFCLVPIVLLGLAGCHVGPGADDFAPAKWPDGVWADLRLKGHRVHGELLEVQDTGLLVLREKRVTFVPLAAIRYGSFRQRTLIENGAPVAAGALTTLRLVSRFPMGLTAELRAALLAAYGQTEPNAARP